MIAWLRFVIHIAVCKANVNETKQCNSVLLLIHWFYFVPDRTMILLFYTVKKITVSQVIIIIDYYLKWVWFRWHCPIAACCRNTVQCYCVDSAQTQVMHINCMRNKCMRVPDIVALFTFSISQCQCQSKLIATGRHSGLSRRGARTPSHIDCDDAVVHSH